MAGEPKTPLRGEKQDPERPTGPMFSHRIQDRPQVRSRWSRVWSNKRQRWTAIGITGMLLISIIAGLAYYWSHQKHAEQDYVEVYITDLPANFTRFDVRLVGVYVGEPNYTLQLLQPRFDLLSLQGPSDALKVASGNIPAGDHQAVRIVFHSARALLNGAWIAVDVPDQMLTVRHDFNTRENPSSAFLFDIDVHKSVHVDDQERLVFRPQVDAIYMHSFRTGAVDQIDMPQSSQPFQKSSPPQFKEENKQKPADQELAKPGGTMRPSNSASPPTTNTKFTWSPADRTTTSTSSPTSTSSSTSSDEFPASTNTEGYLPQPGDAASVPQDPGKPGAWYVHFKPTIKIANDMANAIRNATKGSVGEPPELVFTFASEAVAFVFATPEQAWQMSFSQDIEYVEPDRSIVFNLATSRQAVRMPQVMDPVLGLKDAQGRALDGTGISVAAIDIGFDGTHPDLPHRLTNPANPLLMANYKVESLFTIDLPTTDQTSGHGTHVLGILAGRGISDPTQRGIAPGVRVYGFAIGEGSTTLWPNTALDWLVQNHDKVNPPIKVVTNSWGSGSSYDPNSLTSRLIERLIDAGVTVVFSAGNAGGDGSLAATTSQCQIPKPGLICVAAMDEQQTGTRDGAIAPYSSRGRISNTNSWPDVSAPGTSIRSARPLLGSETGIGAIDGYASLSGTSMAAPHVSGIIALMLQARPGLSPAHVESILEQSAYKFADGGAYSSSGHHAKGHGLVDAYAAISLAKQS